MKNKACKLTDIFGIIRPHINLEFQAVCSQIMSVFVLSTKNGILYERQRSPKSNADSADVEEPGTRFKGQMVFLKDKGFVMFLCSPSVMSLEDLYKYEFIIYLNLNFCGVI
jgi:guanylate cyclase soluble subunit beta